MPEARKGAPIVYVTRRATFASSHRLYRDDLSEAENWKLYGKCTHAAGHGHNYVLEVTLRGPVDPETGMVMNLSDLKKLMEELVLNPMDHRNLNVDVEALRGITPTGENLTVVVWNLLAPRLGELLYEVKIRETENNSTVYRGPNA